MNETQNLPVTQNLPSLDELFLIVQSMDYRLVCLTDMSVVGLARWWCTLHRPGLVHDGIDCKFGEATTPHEAMTIAIASEPRQLSLRSDAPRPAQSDIMSIVFDTEPAQPATFKIGKVTL